MTTDKIDKPFFLNSDFLSSPDARSIRIATEYLGPQNRFIRNHIEDTIVFFGSEYNLFKPVFVSVIFFATLTFISAGNSLGSE